SCCRFGTKIRSRLLLLRCSGCRGNFRARRHGFLCEENACWRRLTPSFVRRLGSNCWESLGQNVCCSETRWSLLLRLSLVKDFCNYHKFFDLIQVRRRLYLYFEEGTAVRIWTRAKDCTDRQSTRINLITTRSYTCLPGSILSFAMNCINL